MYKFAKLFNVVDGDFLCAIPVGSVKYRKVFMMANPILCFLVSFARLAVSSLFNSVNYTG